MTTQPSTQTLFTGQRVCLKPYNPEKEAEQMARWRLNSEFLQLMDSSPATLYPPKLIQDWIEKHIDEMYGFSIYALDGDRMIGFCDIGGVDWTARSGWVGIGVGDPDYWGKGYGTEAMELLLRFAFGGLNLNRVNLNVFEYNERAYKSYLKVGFVEEGRMRQWMARGGERYDLIFMGILHEEWEARHQAEVQVEAANPGPA